MRIASLLLTATIVMAVACTAASPEPAVSLPVLAPVAPSLPLVSAAPPPAEAVSRAAALAQEQPGYRFTFQMSLQGLPEMAGASGFSVSGTGAVDQAGDRSSMALDLRGLRAALAASGDATAAAELDRFLGDGQIEVIQDGSSVYLKMPFIAQRLGAVTPWVSATLPASPPGAPSIDGLGAFGPWSGLGGLGSAGSPADYLAQVKSLDPSIRESGSEVIRGVQTTRYTGSLDIRKLLSSQLSPAEAAQLDAAIPFIDAFRIPYDIWIGADGLPRRMSTMLDFGGLGAPTTAGAPSPGLVTSYELFDYGAPGEIVIPPSSQVTVVDPAVLETLR